MLLCCSHSCTVYCPQCLFLVCVVYCPQCCLLWTVPWDLMAFKQMWRKIQLQTSNFTSWGCISCLLIVAAAVAAVASESWRLPPPNPQSCVMLYAVLFPLLNMYCHLPVILSWVLLSFFWRQSTCHFFGTKMSFCQTESHSPRTQIIKGATCSTPKRIHCTSLVCYFPLLRLCATLIAWSGFSQSLLFLHIFHVFFYFPLVFWHVLTVCFSFSNMGMCR